MTKDELVAILRLQRVPNIGDISAKKLIRHCGSPMAIFLDKTKVLSKIEGIGLRTLENLQKKEYLEAAEREYAYIDQHGIKTHYFLDENYPEYLKHCADGPLVLFSRGNIDLKTPRIISIVGTRSSTIYGNYACERLIAELVPYDPVIVSGYAYGIDICAQKTAVDHGLQTIACLGHGLNQIYPKAHIKYNASLERNGGFLTEFWSTTRPDRENFLRRNRIIAGMSIATVVIESAGRGGSLVTADIANSYHREVFAIPGRTNDLFSAGCNDLIKNQKAQLICSAEDLAYFLGWQQESSPSLAVQKELFVELDETEKIIHAFLKANGKQLLDAVAIGCKLPIFKTSSTLLTMEMKGVIRPLPGKLFEAL